VSILFFDQGICLGVSELVSCKDLNIFQPDPGKNRPREVDIKTKENESREGVLGYWDLCIRRNASGGRKGHKSQLNFFVY
jgi:hypothetical protein